MEPVNRVIESHHNDLFKDLKRILTAKGIRRSHRALFGGPKIVRDTLARHPDRCEALVTAAGHDVVLPNPPRHLAEYRLSPELFRIVDTAGTRFPLLLVKTPVISRWDPAEGLPSGASLLIPFQDPENVGAVIRSAAAFGIDRVILLAECAHPFLPKAIRAAGGWVLDVPFLQGPPLAELPEDLPVLPLSTEGADIAEASFPETFALLPGLEGAGLPQAWRARGVSIPHRAEVESLNAATATAIALYLWSRRGEG